MIMVLVAMSTLVRVRDEHVRVALTAKAITLCSSFTAACKVMPPRRSTRSRASVEPVNEAPKGKSKRKRSLQADVDVAEETPISTNENGDRVKPASRASKPPSRRPSLEQPLETSKLTRSRKSLQHIKEEDEDEDEDEDESEDEGESRPAKKRRASTEVYAEDDESDFEEPPRAKSRVSSRKVSASRASLSSNNVHDNEDEDNATGQPKSKSRSRSSKIAAPKTSSGRTSRASAKFKQESDVLKHEEPELPQKARRQKAHSSHRHANTQHAPAQDDMDEEASSGEVKAELVGKDEDDVAEQIAVTPNDDIKETAPSQSAHPRVEEEEEVSLLDPEPLKPTIPHSQPAVEVEEPKGPRSRLVIYKMVLVSFKSYAGRQEIGPFHKVGCNYLRLGNLLTTSSPSLPLWVQMARASLTLSMPCSLSSVTVLLRCDKASSRSSSTTQLAIQTLIFVLWRFTSARLST
jgi:structural maintenance of chromosome 4